MMSDCIVQLHCIRSDRNFVFVFLDEIEQAHWQNKERFILYFVGTELCIDNAPYNVVALHISGLARPRRIRVV
jgi:hypothetical protein